MKKESSDERLLKLIEGTAEARRMPKVGMKLKNPVSVPAFKINLKFNLHTVTKALYITGAVLTLVFLYSYFTGTKIISADLFLPASSNTDVAHRPLSKERVTFLPLNDYLDALEKRNMFLPFGTLQISEEAVQEDAQAASTAVAMEKDLKLVGIIWSTEPEGMVEDQGDKRTYLLKKGETFGQKQYKVKEVRRDSVVLEIELNGKIKEYELR